MQPAFFVNTHKYTHIHLHTHTHLHTHLHTRLQTHSPTHLHTHTRTHAHPRTCQIESDGLKLPRKKGTRKDLRLGTSTTLICKPMVGSLTNTTMESTARLCSSSASNIDDSSTSIFFLTLEAHRLPLDEEVGAQQISVLSVR